MVESTNPWLKHVAASGIDLGLNTVDEAAVNMLTRSSKNVHNLPRTCQPMHCLDTNATFCADIVPWKHFQPPVIYEHCQPPKSN